MLKFSPALWQTLSSIYGLYNSDDHHSYQYDSCLNVAMVSGVTLMVFNCTTKQKPVLMNERQIHVDELKSCIYVAKSSSIIIIVNLMSGLEAPLFVYKLLQLVISASYHRFDDNVIVTTTVYWFP